jgi:putative ABC transport system substrate-binding protein
MRLIGLVILTLSLTPAPYAAEAQQARKVYRIGYLSLVPAESDRSRLALIRQELRALGYVESQNIVINERHAAARPERLPALAAELVHLKVDVIVAIGDAAASAAKKATSTIPIVMTGADLVGLGLVASLARPGGNFTGVTDSHADLVAKRLDLLKQIAPLASRVAILFNPASPIVPPQLKAAQAAATALGMTVVPVEIKGSSAGDVDPAAAMIRRERPEGLLVVAEPTVAVHRQRITDLAIKIRLPTIGTFRTWAEGGFLMSYGADANDLNRRVVAHVDKILKGANPGDLPVEQPTKFVLVVNMKTARALGLTIPQSILVRADQVIE